MLFDCNTGFIPLTSTLIDAFFFFFIFFLASVDLFFLLFNSSDFQHRCRLGNKCNNHAGHFSPLFLPVHPQYTRTLMFRRLRRRDGRWFLSSRPPFLPIVRFFFLLQPRYLPLSSLLFFPPSSSSPKLIRLFPRLRAGSCSRRLFRSANATRGATAMAG